MLNGNTSRSLQHILEDVLHQATRSVCAQRDACSSLIGISSESMRSLLRHELPAAETSQPGLKRARLDADVTVASTIEQRIQTGFYESDIQVREDIAKLRRHVSSQQNTENGDTTVDLTDSGQKLIMLLDDLGTTKAKHEADADDRDQIIMLRSQTEKGMTTLYSGAQINSTTRTRNVIDGRQLPNGFDLAKPLTLDPVFLAPPKQSRKFADVFGPNRNTKPLEVPRGRTALRSNSLTFNAEAFQERNSPLNRQDFRHQHLTTPVWIDYSKGHSLDEQDISRKYRDKGVAPSDFRAALVANDHRMNESNDNNIALYKQAFSSFAPVTDTSLSLVHDQDQNRSWWRKHGTKNIRTIFKPAYADPDQSAMSLPVETELVDNDFEDVLTYDPSADDDEPPERPEVDTIDEVLEEISHLLETVHSYQSIRSLETRQTADPSKPSNAEFDSYELLRSQLAILIASVPPFIVAKLDGDKLSDLNISTAVRVDSVDYRGTMQADDFTLSKYRSTQQTMVARLPQSSGNAPTPRQPYPAQHQSAAAHYNSGLQAYAANLGVQAANAQRQAQQYATPQAIQQRPNYSNYQHPQALSQTPSYSNQPTVQQFQRQQPSTPVNGYNGAWNTTKNAMTGTPTPTPSQTPSQPGYQQRAAQRMQQQYAHGQYSSTSQQVNGGFPQYQHTAQAGMGYAPPQFPQQYAQQPHQR